LHVHSKLMTVVLVYIYNDCASWVYGVCYRTTGQDEFWNN